MPATGVGGKGTLRTVAEMEIVLRARARGDKHGAIIIKRWDSGGTVQELTLHCIGPGTCLLFYLFIFICLRRSRGLWELCRLYIFFCHDNSNNSEGRDSRGREPIWELGSSSVKLFHRSEF